MNTQNKTAAKDPGREIVITRVLNAPRERVFEAVIDPKQVVKWWGPEGFTTTIHEMDVRPGGVWRHTMHGPDGVDYPNHKTFIEVVKPEKLVFQQTGSKPGDKGVCFRGSWTFEALGDKTRLTLRMEFPDAEERVRVAATYKALEGGNQTLSRLETYLAEQSGEKMVVLTRFISAPRARVFKSWTDPARLAQWWGPRGFTNPRCEIDVRPGGAMHIDMRGPDGKVYPMNGTFKEIVENERLVFTSSALDEKGKPLFEVLTTVTFEDEEAGATKLMVRAKVSSARPEGAPHIAGMNQGWAQSLDRLGEIAGTFIISRTFNAPRELVWKAFTEPERMKEWWGPKGAKILSSKMDFRPGGMYHYGMRYAGQDMWGKQVYREIVPMEKIVFENSFSDENAGVTRHPLGPTWPLRMFSIITLTENAGKTTFTVQWSPMDPTEVEQKTFDDGFESMKGGWTGTFEQLAAYLGKNS